MTTPSIPSDFPPFNWPINFSDREKDLLIERVCIEADGGTVALAMVLRHRRIIQEEINQ